MKKKVVFFSGDMTRSGGTERVLSVIANGLANRDYDITIMSLCGSGESYFELDSRVKMFWIGSKGLQTNVLSNLKKIKKFIKEEQPDFLIDVDIILGFYSFFTRKKCKKTRWIAWEHFNYYYIFYYNQGLRKIARYLVSRFSDCLVVLSDEDKQYYQENMKLKCNIVRMYNPTPYENIPNKTAEEKVVFAAGRLHKIKGFDLLLSSWKMIEDKFPEWKLKIAGTGEEKENLLLQVQENELKNVEFVGHVDNMADCYGRAAFYALSSRSEGFAMVVLEAMAFSLPLVAFECKTGVKEMVEEGVTGYSVPEEDVEGFAHKMELMMESDENRHRMGRNAHDKMIEFSQSRILDRWEQFLNDELI